MKKQLFGILLLLSATSVFSQHTAKAKIGIRIGTAIANIKLEYPNAATSPTYSSKVGLLFGFFVNYSLTNTLILQPGLQYVRKGAKQNSSNSYDSKIKFNYAEIPINLLYGAAQKKGTLYFGGGFSPAFKLASHSAYDSELKNFDLGINALAMYQSTLGFSISLGYTYGLLNNSVVKTNVSNIQNRYLGITAGYEF